ADGPPPPAPPLKGEGGERPVRGAPCAHSFARVEERWIPADCRDDSRWVGEVRRRSPTPYSTSLDVIPAQAGMTSRVGWDEPVARHPFGVSRRPCGPGCTCLPRKGGRATEGPGQPVTRSISAPQPES